MNISEFFRELRTAETVRPFAMERLAEKANEPNLEEAHHQILLRSLLVEPSSPDGGEVDVTLEGLVIQQGMSSLGIGYSIYVRFSYALTLAQLKLGMMKGDISVEGDLHISGCFCSHNDIRWEKFSPALLLGKVQLAVPAAHLFGSLLFESERTKFGARPRHTNPGLPAKTTGSVNPFR